MTFLSLGIWIRFYSSLAKLDSATRKIDLLAHDVKFLLHVAQRNALSEDVVTPENLTLPINEESELNEFKRKLAGEIFFSNVVCILIMQY